MYIFLTRYTCDFYIDKNNPFSVFDGISLPDPTESEEDIQSGAITCCVDEANKLRAMWASVTLPDDMLSAALLYIQKRAGVLLSVLQRVSKRDTQMSVT